MSKAKRLAESKLDEFVLHAVIDVIVPEAEELDASDFSETQYTSFRDEDEESHLSLNVPRRQTLYLDETVNVYIVLRTPFLEEVELQSYLSRLSLSLDTVVAGYAPQSPDDGKPAKPLKEVIDSRKVQATQDPLVIVGDASSEHEDIQKRFIYVLWKVEVHISRSKIRCLQPTAHFVPSAAIRPLTTSKPVTEEYLPSGVPASANILAALKYDPQFSADPPILLASRMVKVPSAPHFVDEFSRQLQTAPRRSIRIVPAISTRLRFLRFGLSPAQAKVLASLDIEISPHLDGTATIQTIEFILSDGAAEPMTTGDVLSLPLTCRAHDEMTFIYNLRPDRRPIQSKLGNSVSMYTLNMSASATIHRNNDTKSSSRINITWRTTVDLSQLTKSPLPATISNLTSSANHDIIMTISGPPQVHVQESFKWDILLANRSATRSLRLVLIPIPKLAPQHAKSGAQVELNKHRPGLSGSSLNSVTAGGATKPARSPGIASATELDPVMDPLLLYNHTHPTTASQYSARSLSSIDPTRIIPLSADVVVGPIPPGACQTAEMEFLPLQEGLLNLDAIRVIDMDSREGLDVIWLPDIVSVRDEDNI